MKKADGFFAYLDEKTGCTLIDQKIVLKNVISKENE